VWKSIPSPLAKPRATRAGILLRWIVPIAIAALLWFAGRRTMAIVVVSIGLTLALAGLVSRSANHRIEAAGAWLGRVVGGGISTVLLGAVFLLVFTLTSFVLRLMGRDPLATAPDPSRVSYWVRAPRTDRPLHRWQFAIEPKGTATRSGGFLRGLVGFAAAAFLLNLVGGALLRATGAFGAESDPRAKAAAYDGADWVDDYYREYTESSEQKYTGFTGWRRKDFSGRYINVVDGIRRTPRESAPSGAACRVFFFGGSTMWGLGSRDEHTIPSEVLRLAANDGIAVEATNFGEIAYVSWQEVLLLAEQCANGNVPDVAVFYDGVNDVFVQLQQPTPTPLPQNYASLRDRFEKKDGLARALSEHSAVHLLLGAARKGASSKPYEVDDLPAPVSVLGENAAAIHRRSIEHARRLGEAYGFDVVAFWQPCIYTKARLHEREQPLLDEFGPGLGAVYADATKRVGGAAEPLTTALDGLEGPVLIDWCHTNEEGSRAIARAVYASLREKLRTCASPSAGEAS